MVKFGPSISWVSLTGFMGLASCLLALKEDGARYLSGVWIDRVRRMVYCSQEKVRRNARRGRHLFEEDTKIVEPAGKYIRHPNGVLELSAPGDAGAGTFNHDSSFMARPGFIQRSGYHEDDDEHQHEHQHTVSVRSVNYPHVRHKNGVLRIDAFGNKAPSFTSDATFVAVAGRHGRN